MTTGKVNDLGTFFSSNVAGQMAQSTKNQSAQENFSQVLSKTNDRTSTQDTAVKVTAAESDTRTSEAGQKSKAIEDDSSKGRLAGTVNENGKPQEEKDLEVKNLDRNEPADNPEVIICEVVGDASLKAELVITDMLDITDEELSEIMEELGISPAQLLLPENLQMIYSKINGLEEPAQLLTNEELYSTLTELMGSVETVSDEVKSELALSDEELKEIITEFDSQQPAEFQTAEVKEEKPEEKKVLYSFTDERKTKVDTTVDSMTDTKLSVEEEIPQDTVKYESRRESYHGNEEFSQEMNQEAAPDNTFTVAAEEPTLENFSYAGRNIEAADIQRQIVEQIRVKVTEATTSLEMELNPAALGRVGLSIEMKNGAMTASFSAQNEAVKEVIESQVLQLQENLDKQGVKVEAVEVTIASHEFEQNLDKQNQNRGDEEAEKLKKELSQKRMRINLLDEAEGEAEDISDDEALNRDIMERNGNSLDYMA